MIHAHTKLTSQGQVSVPAAVRRALGLTPGTVLEWVEEKGRIVVKRATRHDSQAVHDALFPEGATPVQVKSLDDLKQGIRQRMKRRHAGD
ncbi:AbrB/MazE/SpoVT family DNA-binding domain-containing protein [Variovorax sp. PAMC28562]|uniref:AbrB/MazE/SpoVT family DNA-binding domain-containing protein n=1 Tax=Variovorax sp. PAMC28562 TaxID=2762323 RepID=UPI00164DB974|nr:AbrB/MazE/SpoVT family DNA-binding domain-containing protein [Variovorax sp. PAMC28562]QNK72201.1 AbrB/MazE/SpoVT family DNA-binding domain-containing protein [Variovorax sp. PAMC28562]